MPRGETVSGPQEVSTWTALDLRCYLLALSYNSLTNDYCLAQRHFPKRIELSRAWHETFHDMRRITREQGIETWCFVGVTHARDRVLVSHRLIWADAGDPLAIPEAAMDASLTRAARHGVLYGVADIHTHPLLETRSGREKLWEDEFSGRDLEAMLESRAQPAVKFLVGPTRNAAVFRSRETELIDPLLYHHRDYELFLTGKKYRAANNLVIADRHRLVFFRGQPNQPLVRVFPSSL